MHTEITDSRKSWQKKAWVQWVAIVLILLLYGSIILFNTWRDSPPALRDILFYTIVISSLMIAGQVLVLRFFCGERVRDLNRRTGSWWKDILAGIGLSVVTLGIKIITDNPINSLFPRNPNSGLGNIFNEMLENPILFALMIGPGLLIGAGIGEELTRAFLLTRFWNLTENKGIRWLAVLLSAVVFGMAHIYQGMAGVISTGISGLIIAAYYMLFGRFPVMIIAHYLHDAIQFVFVYIMAKP